ncbi:MAG TPA: cytochrome c oxidase subunit II [Nocardioidaceae bacterium]|nr:cytochrome c oxidase subunit II [Nocardioidaceae bacterium]
MTVMALCMLPLAACSAQQDTEFKRLAEPVGVTDRTPAMHHLWMWAWLAAFLVGILVWGLIIYAAFKFRRKPGDESAPVQTRYHLPIEILYTVAPIVMVVVFFFFTVKTQDEVLKPAADVSGHAAHTIDVVGSQWSWTFNYVKDPALDGQTSVWFAGTTAHAPTLVLPVNESVRFNLSSPDVIHSFWVPAFLFKMDVIPGRHNHFSLTPTRTGTFKGRCAELCGVYHSRMLFNVKIVSHADYAKYLRHLESIGNTGLALGGSDARTVAGLKPAGQNGAEQ